MNLSTFLDTYKDAIAQRVVASYPPQYRPAADDRPLPPLLRSPAGRAGDRHPRHRPLPRHPARHHRRRRDGYRQDLHRHRRRPPGRLSSASWCSSHPTSPASGSGRSQPPSRTPAPPSSPPSPPWSGCGAPPAPARSSPSSPASAPSSPTAGSPPSFQRWATADGRLLRDEATGEPFRVPTCPVCASQVVTPDGVPLTDAELARRKRTCGAVAPPSGRPTAAAPAAIRSPTTSSSGCRAGSTC